jgi:YEATS family
MHQATPINTLGGEEEQGSLSHQVKVWIDAASHQTLSNIQKVVYYFHPTFNPSEIASDNPSDNFAISLNVWGEFEIKATVFFKDGSTKGLSRYLLFSTGSSFSQNSITSTDTTSNFLTYEHPVYHYTIQYPSNWEVVYGHHPEFISPLEGNNNDDRYRANIVIDFSPTGTSRPLKFLTVFMDKIQIIR